MSGKRLSELNAISEIATNDILMIVDVSDQSMGPGGTNKTISINQLIGPIYNVTPGSISANKALVADGNAKIEGVSATQLASLNTTFGEWAANKALIVDNDGKVQNVSSSQFQRLNVTAGQWSVGKVLVVDDDGKVSGVSGTQFQCLNVTAGQISAGKVAVWNNNAEIASNTLSLKGGSTGQVEIIDSSNNRNVTLTASTIRALYIDGSTNKYAKVEYDGLTIDHGEIFATRYKYGLMQIANSTNTSNITAGTVFLQSGGDTLTLNPSTLSFSLSSGTLSVYLRNLPTSDPLVAGQIWRDNSGYLRISLGE